MSTQVSPSEIADRLLAAGNARNIDAYCALFARNAVIRRLDSNQGFLKGIDSIRKHYIERFKLPKLHCEIKSRIEMGHYIVDHECVTGLEKRSVEVIAVLEIRNSLIRSICFIWP